MQNSTTIQLSELVYQGNGGLVLVYTDGQVVVVEPCGRAFLAPVFQTGSVPCDSPRGTSAARAMQVEHS